MKNQFLILALFAIALPTLAQKDVSFQNELQRSIDRGLASLQASQHKDGWWTSPEHPAVTALVLVAYQGNPNKPKQTPAWITKAYDYLLKQVQPNGSIYMPGKGLANYNTSLCMMAMLTSGNAKYNPIIVKARNFLVDQQFDEGTPGKMDHPLDGGVGYVISTTQ